MRAVFCENGLTEGRGQVGLIRILTNVGNDPTHVLSTRGRSGMTELIDEDELSKNGTSVRWRTTR